MTAIVVVAPDDLGNFLVGCQAITPTNEDALFPKSFLTDGDIGPLFRFGTNAASLNILADLNRITKGDMETWPLSAAGMVNQSVGTGTITQETTIVQSGTSSAKFTSGGAGNEAILKIIDLRVQSGALYTVSAGLRGDSTATIRLYVQNLQSGKWLGGAGTWNASKVECLSQQAASWATGTIGGFTVEAASISGFPVATLRVTAEVVVTGAGYLDNVLLWPWWDFAGVFGHNLGGSMIAKIQSDDNSAMSSPTDRVTFTLRRPSMYGTASIVGERYARLLLTGTNHAAPECGELVLGQKMNLTGSFNPPPYDITPEVGLVGYGRRPVSLRDDESMAFSVSLLLTEPEWDDMRVRLLSVGRWGGRRTILVPLDTRGEVHYGTFLPGSISRMGAGALYRLSGEFQELEYTVRTT